MKEEITGAIDTLEKFISEKEALQEEEGQLLRSLTATLNRLGYDIVPCAGSGEVPRKALALAPAGPKRRGRPRKYRPDSEASLVDGSLAGTDYSSDCNREA